MSSKDIYIQKYNGDKEIFNIEKLKNSLSKSGASDSDVDVVVKTIEPQIFDGMESKQIYKQAFAILKKNSRSTASKYSLKRAIFELGPAGYHFESLIGAVLDHRGFKTEVGIVLQGACVTHEVDVLAEKDGFSYAVECKFHSDPKAVDNVKIPLYINSRFLDLQAHWNASEHRDSILKQGWLVSNTRFSSDAIQYAECVGLQLLSWDYPEHNGIKHNIDLYALYPITTLTTITKREKELILEQNIILNKDLFKNAGVLEKVGLSPIRIKRVLSEIKELCALD